MPRDIIILHKCTTSDNTMYGSPDTKHKAQQTGFFSFYPTNNQNNQNFEKM